MITTRIGASVANIGTSELSRSPMTPNSGFVTRVPMLKVAPTKNILGQYTPF